jgi:hypothetical protein
MQHCKQSFFCYTRHFIRHDIRERSAQDAPSRPRSLALMTLAVLASIAFTSVSHAATSGIFGGGPFYINATNNINEIKNSGFTEAIIWNIQVRTNGDLNFNGEFPLVSNGTYVGNQTHPDFPSNMAALKTGTIKRITFSIGSSNVGDWQNVRALVNAQGTGTASILFRNFQALKAAIPVVDAFDFDDENSYDQSSTVQFAVMLGNLGFRVALDPFTNNAYWINVAAAVNAQLPGTVDSVHLQAYAGGAGNSPCSGWSFGAVPVLPGLWDRSSTPAQVQTIMTSWHNQCGITGGFMWLYDDFVGSGLVAQYAAAINNAVGGTSSGIYNQSFGIVNDGTTFSGGIDGVGSAYSASLLGASLVWNGVSFTFGPANGADVISGAGQTIALATRQTSSVSLLALAVNGTQTSQVFVVNYTDGTTSRYTQSMSDWFVPAQYPGESIARSMAYRNTSNGGRDNRTFNLYGYAFATNTAKTVKSITLPSNAQVKVLAIGLRP